MGSEVGSAIPDGTVDPLRLGAYRHGRYLTTEKARGAGELGPQGPRLDPGAQERFDEVLADEFVKLTVRCQLNQGDDRLVPAFHGEEEILHAQTVDPGSGPALSAPSF